MAVKLDGTEPNVFPAVEGIDVRDAGRNAEIVLAVEIAGKLTPNHDQIKLCTGQRLGGPFGAVPKGVGHGRIQLERL